MTRLLLSLLVLLANGSADAAEPALPTEADYYTPFKLPIPAGVVLEVGGLELLPDGKLAASSRRGDIYTITNPFSNAPYELHLPGIRSATRLPLLYDVAYYTLNHIPAAN